MGAFDWVPNWVVDVGGFSVNLAWVLLIAFVFVIAALITYSPCNMPLLWPSNSFLPQCQG
jgi:hypothetical protein